MWRLLRLLPPPVLTFVKRNTSPRLRFAIRQRLGADYRDIPDTVISTRDGRRFHIGPDPIYWAIYQGLDYEPEATALLRRLLRRGDVVADVGANIGWYSTLCAGLVGETGHVYAFEPVPDTRKRLEENLVLNAVQDRVTVVSKALGAIGAASGEIHLVADQSASLASMSSFGAPQFTTVSVEMTSVDEFARARGIRQLSLLKCDVEGAELDVLRGAERLLSVPDAPLVLIELNKETLRAFGHTKEDVMRALERLGYTQFFDVASARSLRRVHLAKDLASIDLMLSGKSPDIDQRIAAGGVRVAE